MFPAASVANRTVKSRHGSIVVRRRDGPCSAAGDRRPGLGSVGDGHRTSGFRRAADIPVTGQARAGIGQRNRSTDGVAGDVVSIGFSVSAPGALKLPAASLSVAETTIVSAPVKAFGRAAYVSKLPLVVVAKSARSCAALSATLLDSDCDRRARGDREARVVAGGLRD